ncbi:MAG: alginate lyase family protein [Phycisphaerales bacterium]|nr:MAG: alginate lyase family protein [Phycisphaerales bacterium]
MASNLERITGKLRREGPWSIGRRLLYRRWRRVKNRRRRRRWQQPDVRVPAGAVDGSSSIAHAQQLWPGAAERTWLGLAQRRWPDLHSRARRTAEGAAEGRFDLLGSGPVNVKDDRGRIRWHDDFKASVSFPHDVLYLDVPILLQEGADVKVPWELSRFQHVFAFLWTAPERYGPVFLEQWRDWMAANPVARGVNWSCTMDVALRAITWTAALAAWGAEWEAKTRQSFVAALATHGRFVRDNLEWAVGARTNHYFTDIVALAVLGQVLSPYPEARDWLSFARKELEREVPAQFAPDGFNKECSTTYHRLMVELATLGALACRRAGFDLEERCRERIVQSYRAIAACVDARGRAPLIGDNDSSRLFPLVPRADEEMGHLLPVGAEVLDVDELAGEEASPELVLLTGQAGLQAYDRRAAGKSVLCPKALPDGGVFVLGDRHHRVVFRCGPLTYPPVGGHRHLDQLSITVTAGGLAMIVDPGQYCYTPYPQRRNGYRATAAHNTVEVDGELQCRVFTRGTSIYSVINDVSPSCDGFVQEGDRVRITGRHVGYARLPGGGEHVRCVEYDPVAIRWTVSDRLALQGAHLCVWRFHLHPEASVAARDGGWMIERRGVRLLLRWLDRDAPTGEVTASTYASGYGQEVPTQTLVFRKETDGMVDCWCALALVREGE